MLFHIFPKQKNQGKIFFKITAKAVDLKMEFGKNKDGLSHLFFLPKRAYENLYLIGHSMKPA